MIILTRLRSVLKSFFSCSLSKASNKILHNLELKKHHDMALASYKVTLKPSCGR